MIGFEYKIRFHLQRGQHYMHWQIKAYDGTVKYIDPQKYQIEMYDAKLINKTNADKVGCMVQVRKMCADGLSVITLTYTEADSISTLNTYGQTIVQSYQGYTLASWR